MLSQVELLAAVIAEQQMEILVLRGKLAEKEAPTSPSPMYERERRRAEEPRP